MKLTGRMQEADNKISRDPASRLSSPWLASLYLPGFLPASVLQAASEIRDLMALKNLYFFIELYVSTLWVQQKLMTNLVPNEFNSHY